MKIKSLFPRFPRLKARKGKKLRATAVRRPLRIAATADYEEMNEPNMKLSRALLIVLLLHVVAVSGIIAFNAIKTHQPSLPPRPRVVAAESASVPASKMETPSHATLAPKEPARQDAKALQTSARPVAKEDRKGDHAKSGDPAKHDASGKVYIVAKGDNPVAIAKKLKVSYDELLALNHIDDPRKLQIGQKLLIPTKTTKSKKDE
ncbi:MAG: LysM domain [Verrucomicrobiota bacterium]|jgi:LysM repeat protein